MVECEVRTPDGAHQIVNSVQTQFLSETKTTTMKTRIIVYVMVEMDKASSAPNVVVLRLVVDKGWCTSVWDTGYLARSLIVPPKESKSETRVKIVYLDGFEWLLIMLMALIIKV